MIRLLVDLVPCAPAAGLALEEALFETARAEGEDSLRIWTNDRAVVIGRSQGAASEVDASAARDLGIPVLRRLSGGGAVYHYPGNLNVSLYLKDGRPLGGVAEAFARLGGTLARGLAAFGPGVTLAENSLLIDGRKVGGAAQARRGASLLYHATLLLEPDAILLERLLLALRMGYRPTGVPSRPRPTTTLVEAWGRVPDREDLAQTIANATSRLLKRPLRRGNITQSEEDRARNLTREKYGRDEWNLSR